MELDVHKLAKEVRRIARSCSDRISLARSDYDRLRAAGYGIECSSMTFTELGVVEVAGFVGYREPFRDGDDID